jgi:hypothetical protein
MYSASPEFVTAIHAPGRSLRSRITRSGGLTLDDTVITSMEFKRAVTPDSGLLLGTVIAAQLTVRFLDPEGALNPEDFTGWELTPEIAVQLADESYEYVPMGIFVVDRPVRREAILEIVAYDRMVRLEMLYVSALTYPTTMGAVLQEIASLAGLELVTADVLNADLVVSAPIDGVTLRQALSFCAEVAVGFARITRDGKLEIVSLPLGSAVEQITPANYFPPMTVADEPWWADGVIVKVAPEDAGLAYGEATRPWAITGNPLLAGHPEVAIHTIVGALAGVELWPFNVDWQGNPALDPGDSITIQDVKTGMVRVTMAGVETLSYSGGLRSSLSLAAPSSQRQATDTGIEARAYELVTTAKIADAAITSAKIGQAQITDAHINDLSADKINAGTLDASVVNVININAANINTGKMSADLIGAGTIDANEVNVRNLHADEITVGAINGYQISQGAITGGPAGHIAPGTITGANIAYIEADYIKGGDLMLGGAVNESTYNGRILMKRADGSVYGKIDREGIEYNDTFGNATLAFKDDGISFGQTKIVRFSSTTRSGIGIFAV